MPSPVAHAAVGYFVYKAVAVRRQPSAAARGGRPSPLLMLTVGMSLFPDVDVLAGIAAGDIQAFHNAAMSSLAAALIASLLAAAAFRVIYREKPLFAFAVAFLCYGVHLLMDFFTSGRGVMLLWPFFSDRFVSPVKLFYGLHYSDGLLSARHLWTALSELLFVLLLLGAIHLMKTRLANGTSCEINESFEKKA
ncbi:MAG: metal-dependent hydrolase [Desulfosoma sp.]